MGTNNLQNTNSNDEQENRGDKHAPPSTDVHFEPVAQTDTNKYKGLKPITLHLIEAGILAWMGKTLHTPPQLKELAPPKKQKPSHPSAPSLGPIKIWMNLVNQYLCLFNEQNLDLRTLQSALDQNQQMLEQNPKLKRTFLEMLNASGYLIPAPAIWWRGNRNMDQYSDRLRMDLKGFLQALPRRKNQTVLEFGPGCGASKEDIVQALGGDVNYIGISNALYYQQEDLIEQSLDFDALAEAGADLRDRPDDPALTAECRKKRRYLCRFIYKVLAIEAGRTMEPDVPYDKIAMSMLRKNPNALVDILREKGHLLPTTKKVPNDNGIRNPDDENGMLFPDHDDQPADPESQKALELLGNADGTERFLTIGNGKSDAYDKIPINVRGTMMADFRQAHNLADRQVDVALGVRSTVYLNDADYLAFMTKMATLLGEEDGGGVYIDDNVRINFGTRYRIKELVELERQLQITDPAMRIRVICAKGFEEGEDNVPITVVMSRSEEKLKLAAAHVHDNTSFLSPSELDKPENWRHWATWHLKQRKNATGIQTNMPA